jgi:hypothetical protein
VTTKAEMTVDQHVQTAFEFLGHSDREFTDGDALQGSEKLWGAASHAVMAIAKQRDWRFGKSNHRAVTVERLAQEFDDPLLVSDYGIAEKFHANFYHDFMENESIERYRPIVRRFVQRIADIVNEKGKE